MIFQSKSNIHIVVFKETRIYLSMEVQHLYCQLSQNNLLNMIKDFKETHALIGDSLFMYQRKATFFKVP